MKSFQEISKKNTTEKNSKNVNARAKTGKIKKAAASIKSGVTSGLTKVSRWIWFGVGLALLLVVGVSFFAPLVKNAGKVDYFDYVSELRSNILVAENGDFSLRAFAVEKEYPYKADGVRREMTQRAEVYLVAPSGDKVCSVTFSLDGKKYGGEMSYDNVKAEYFFSVSADLSDFSTLDFSIEYGENQTVLTGKTVKKSDTLSARDALEKLRENEAATFDTLTDQNGFVGEIYLRLICEDTPYYYIGLIEKNGKIRAYLLAADSGKVLAKRES